jgi:hypothetical protein
VAVGPTAREPALDASFRGSRQGPDLVARPSLPDVGMKILCAWCCRDGLPGYMGEREPFDNPEPTHGICEHHKAEVLESEESGGQRDARTRRIREGSITSLDGFTVLLTAGGSAPPLSPQTDTAR